MRDPDDAVAMPGELTRMAFGEGAPVASSTRDGGAKDAWVLS